MQKLKLLVPSKKTLLLLPVGYFGAFFGFGCYVHPPLRDNPMSFVSCFRRYCREVAAGVRVGVSYYRNWNNTTSELHYKNARILYNMMCINGGIYIKAGQIISQCDSMIPDEWLEVFEPM